ncbi:LysR family transcriptional regulator [Hyphomicrobium facile]|uniref:DNA-binding transcriptional regulator, LysR family n=1 Tax=Hyphomicrobium facile TaxID=51670 RepID=A0A1I7NU11_9HYPH|nr:LysR family transcriptional regulator [Hyphomicrobium facile]SFV38112.1 DNA-binding transcriptional regulator, LysR family [Hyphomicrobium facile]
MDLKQLKHFVAAAEEQHFTRAARKMNIVQSGLSASIRALEQEMGAPLFVRTTRRVELTVAGQVLYERALLIIAGVRDARRAVAAISGLERGSLSIGTCASLNAFFDLPLLLGEFHALHPDVEIRLCHSTAAKLMDKVKDSSIDLAFLPLYEKSREIVSMPIASDRLVVAHPLGHPLEGRESVSLHSLAGETFVDFQLDQGTRRIVDRAFAAINVSRKTALEVGDVQVLLDLVARGFGIALVPYTFVMARAAQSTTPKIGITSLRKPGIRWELVAAFSGRAGAAQSRNPAVAAFTGVLDRVRSEKKLF